MHNSPSTKCHDDFLLVSSQILQLTMEHACEAHTCNSPKDRAATRLSVLEAIRITSYKFVPLTSRTTKNQFFCIIAQFHTTRVFLSFLHLQIMFDDCMCRHYNGRIRSPYRIEVFFPPLTAKRNPTTRMMKIPYTSLRTPHNLSHHWNT